MKCKHDNCFTCPYPDCIIDARDAVVDLAKQEERKRKHKEYYAKYYEQHKAEISEARKKAYRRKKAGKFI